MAAVLLLVVEVVLLDWSAGSDCDVTAGWLLAVLDAAAVVVVGAGAEAAAATEVESEAASCAAAVVALRAAAASWMVV